jgi:VanZ family protein
LKPVLKYQVPPVLFAVLIYFLAAIPNVHLIIQLPVGADKIVHAVLFFVLCWLMWRAFYYQHTLPVIRNSAILGAFIFCVIYGILDEYHDSFVPGRSADFFDVVADAGGALLFVAIASLRRLHRREIEENPQS